MLSCVLGGRSRRTGTSVGAADVADTGTEQREACRRRAPELRNPVYGADDDQNEKQGLEQEETELGAYGSVLRGLFLGGEHVLACESRCYMHAAAKS